MTQPHSFIPSITVPARPSSWFGRNKSIAIAMLVIGGLILAVSALAAVLLTVTFTALRSSDAYQLALKAATVDPAVAAALGPPVRAGWLTTGRVSVSGPSGDASLAIPVAGSRASGTLNVSAQKSGGRWTFSVLNVDIAGRPTPIDLLPAGPRP